MTKEPICPNCRNNRAVTCLCCDGIETVTNGLAASNISKVYICADCMGEGQVPCPRCRPVQRDIQEREIPVKGSRLGYSRF